MVTWLARLSLAGIVAVSIAGCDIAQKIIDPVKKERKDLVVKVYEKDGVSFSYPDNWKVTEDATIEGDIRHINVEDSDNTLFIIQIMSSDFEVDLDDHAAKFIINLPSNLPMGKIVGATRGTSQLSIAGHSYDGVQVKYSVAILGETVPHTFDVFLAKGIKTNALIMIQAPDEDLKAAEKEIHLISESLKLE